MKVLRYSQGKNQIGINLEKAVDFKMILGNSSKKYHFIVRLHTASKGAEIIVIESKEESDIFMKAFYEFLSNDETVFNANNY